MVIISGVPIFRIFTVTLWREDVVDNVRVNNVLSYQNNINLKPMKSNFKGSYHKQTLTLVAILYEFMKLAEGSFHKFHMK